MAGRLAGRHRVAMTSPLPILRMADAHAGALDEQLARALRPIAIVISGAYLVTVVQRLLEAGPAAGTAPTAVVPMVAFLLVGLLPAWRPIPAALANPILVLGLGLVTVEALGAGPEAAGSTLQWALIGLGAVVLRPRWGVASAGAIVAPWLLVTALGLGGWHPGQVRFIADMVAAAAIGTVIFVARRRAVLGLVTAGSDLTVLAGTDPLTGLRNRRGLEVAATAALGAGTAAPLQLVYLDLDGFKSVNDRLGHAEGDRALVAVADVLRSTFRAADVIGRVGGDEFVVLVAAGSDADTAARRLQDRLAAWRHEDARYQLRASVGTGVVAGSTLAAFWAAVEAADRRMYADKQARRGRTLAMLDAESAAATTGGGTASRPMVPVLG
jgi:diguanylate cyclase (GGDEF)-like protein